MSAAFEADRVDLAREARFRIGGLEVRPSRREVRAGGVSEILEPRVMQVLVALARQGGEVVSRTELVASCWDGRVVTDDAINRCIARVRRLGDAHAAFRIETVPRVGYRLVALDSGAAAPVPPSVSAKPARGLSKRRWIQAAALGIAATVVAAAAAAWVQRPPRYEALPVRALISTPMIERHPAFSPDGTMIAYAAGPNSFQRDILVRRLAGGDPIRMTDEAGDEAGLSWSPDGGRIAYILYVQGEPCRIRVRTIPAGPPRRGRALPGRRALPRLVVSRRRPHLLCGPRGQAPSSPHLSLGARNLGTDSRHPTACRRGRRHRAFGLPGWALARFCPSLRRPRQ